MATEPRNKEMPLPKGSADDKYRQFSPQQVARFFVEEIDTDTLKPVRRTVDDLPIGCDLLTLVPRQCGDWYCEIYAGKKAVAAIGADREAAFAAGTRKIKARLAA